MKMKSLILFLISILFCLSVFSASEANNVQKRFYSRRFAIQIDLPEGYKMKNAGEYPVFHNEFANIEMRYYLHKDFSEVYTIGQRMGRGMLIAQNREVRFAHCRILRASRGGYLIFKNGDTIQHFTVLKKEYRSYLFISTLKESNLNKLKLFIESIRLLLPDEKNYEGEKNGFLYRLTFSSDSTYRFSIIRGSKVSVVMGTFKPVNSEIHLQGNISVTRSDDESTRVAQTNESGIVYKGREPESFTYLGVLFKFARVSF